MLADKKLIVYTPGMMSTVSISEYARILGRAGGAARAGKMTAARRREIARSGGIAANARRSKARRRAIGRSAAKARWEGRRAGRRIEENARRMVMFDEIRRACALTP